PPPIKQLQPLTPPELERVVRKCLAKDADDRWQSASDLAAELKWSAEPPSQTYAAAEIAGPMNWSRIARLVAAAALVTAVAFVLGTRWPRPAFPTTQFEVYPPPKTYFNFRGLSGPPLPSPAGQKVAFLPFKLRLNG